MVGLYVPPMDLYIKVGIAGGDWVRVMVSRSTSIEESSRLEYPGYQRMTGGPNARSKGLFDSFKVVAPRRLVLDPLLRRFSELQTRTTVNVRERRTYAHNTAGRVMVGGQKRAALTSGEMIYSSLR